MTVRSGFTRPARPSDRRAPALARPDRQPGVASQRQLAALAMAAALALAGCASQPPRPPAAAAPFVAPAQFKEQGDWKAAHGATAASVPDPWWTLFGDPVLNDLQARLVVNNETLKAAVAQVAQAQAALQSARAASSPTLGLGADASRSGSGIASGARSTSNALALSANAAWELDLWGRLKQTTQAAQSRAQASADDLAAARLSAAATLAQTYFALRTAEAQIALLQRTEQADQRVLQLTQLRLDAGVVTQADLLQARTQLGSVQAQREDAQLQRAQLEHALAVLVGQAPSDFALPPPNTEIQVPAVPELLPSRLLERRPDIAAAQQRVAAAWQDLGAANAAAYPDISLSASTGLKAAALGRLFSAPSLAWALGGAVAQSVLDGGARQAASNSAQAAADVATASYRQTVLTAFQEVEDNLAAAQALDREEALQRDALDAARRNQAITESQYRAGTVSFLNVASAQASALTAESAVLQARQRRLVALNTLLKNVAGRWA